MEAIIQPLPASNARHSPLFTTLSPSQLRRAELAVGTRPNEGAPNLGADTVRRRCEDWPEKLKAYLEKNAEKPFDWGTHNCSLFAADWVLECCGLDPLGRLREECKDRASALAILARKGGVGGLWARACHRYGWPQVHRYYAQRGDLVLYRGQGGHTGIGICAGESFAALEIGGLGRRDMAQATHAFKIG